MALSNDDWARLDRMQEQNRDHLDSVTEKLDADSQRQWSAIAKLDKKLAVHEERSDSVHGQPCPTALALVGKHEDESPAHNPKKTIAILATLFSIAGAIGGGAAWLIHWLKALPAHVILVGAVLALAGGGCCGASNNTVYEEDRVLVDMNIQILKKQKAVLAALSNNPGGFVAEMEQLDRDAIANNEQLQKNWGAPDNRIDYTPAAAAAARDSSDKKHTTSAGFWGAIGCGILGGATLIIGLARTPLVRLIPGIGQIIASFDPLLAGAEKFMASQKAKGAGGVAAELAEAMAVEQKSAKVHRYISKRLGKVKKKIAPALDAIEDLTRQPDEETKILPAESTNPT